MSNKPVFVKVSVKTEDDELYPLLINLAAVKTIGTNAEGRAVFHLHGGETINSRAKFRDVEAFVGDE